MATEFVTLKEAKRFLKIDESETKFDAIINELRTGYSKGIQNWTGRDIVSTTYNEYFDIGYQQTSIKLKQYPVTSVVAMTHNGVAQTENTDFYVYESSGIIKKKASNTIITSYRTLYNVDYFIEGLRTVSVCYVAGWASTAIPDDIKLATNMLIYELHYDRDSGTVKSQSIGGDSVTRFDLKNGMPPGVEGLLKPYVSVFK